MCADERWSHLEGQHLRGWGSMIRASTPCGPQFSTNCCPLSTAPSLRHQGRYAFQMEWCNVAAAHPGAPKEVLLTASSCCLRSFHPSERSASDMLLLHTPVTLKRGTFAVSRCSAHPGSGFG